MAIGVLPPSRRCGWLILAITLAVPTPSAHAPASGAPGPASRAHRQQGEPAWRQWGGPRRDFIIDVTGLADSWPPEGPRAIWSRPLGVGHSAILADDGLLFTMYRVGDARSRGGPWEEQETVIAMDVATGETVWEYTYHSRIENFSYGAGPHSTPLIVGDRLFTMGTNKQFFAFDKRTGEVLWSHDLVADFGAPPLLLRPSVTAGYGCSPIAYEDTVICTVGGPGQSVVAFRQTDGSVAWRSGDFLFSNAPPSLITVDGQEQLVVVGGATVNGLDPKTGEVLWAVPHDPGNDLNITAPLWGDGNILFVSSAYRAGSQALRLSLEDSVGAGRGAERAGGAASGGGADSTEEAGSAESAGGSEGAGGVAGGTRVEQLWFSSRLQFMFLNTIRLGDWVYGTEGTFGPAFMTAVNVVTGEAAWRERGFGRSSLVYADGKFIIMDEDGDLALARMSPEGMTVLARATIFDTTSWTVPTLVGTTLYARDREKILALDLAGG